VIQTPVWGEENGFIMADEYVVHETKSGSSWQLPAIVILALLALGALGFAWSNSAKLDAQKQAIADQVKAAQTSVQQDVSTLKDRLAADEKINNDLQGDLKVVTDKLKITQGQLKKARQEAITNNNQTADLVKNLDTSVHSELATKATTDDVKTVDTRVTKVSGDLDKTNSDLSMARSELGTLIAKNHDEIDSLRRMGERDYIEFTISGKNKSQRVGNVTVELKGVNEKRNRSNITYTFEDKSYEAKNANVNTPIFFYPSGSRQPEELVINKVGKNTVSGYLSVPKANSQSASNSNSKSGS
jgi:predicted  nucleic acid-binding Zn-ribbon protein